MLTLLALTNAHAATKCDLRVIIVSQEWGDTAFLKVTNQGGRSCAGFWVDVFVDAPNAPMLGDLGDVWLHFPSGLAAGASTGVYFDHPDISTRTDRFFIDTIVDTGNEVSESDENDNIWSVLVDGSVPGWYKTNY